MSQAAGKKEKIKFIFIDPNSKDELEALLRTVIAEKIKSARKQRPIG